MALAVAPWLLAACAGAPAKPVRAPDSACCQELDAPSAVLAAPAPIRVEGDDDFRAWTAEALELLETRAPEAFAMVSEHVSAIAHDASRSGMEIPTQTYRVTDVTSRAPGWPRGEQLAWYASTIVHDAHHSRIHRRGENSRGRDAELECLREQRTALVALGASPFLADYVDGLIRGADDPENQYWTVENRHW